MSDTLRGMFDPDASTVPGTVKEASRIVHTGHGCADVAG
jgi:hypothetical protein